MISEEQISELEPGVFSAVLEPCTCRVLPHVLAPVPSSVVWVVRHTPQDALLWTELPVPLAPYADCELLRVRGLSYDFQLPLTAFVDLVPRLPTRPGVILLQMDRAVPDSLDYSRIEALPQKYSVLRQNGWLLSFWLPHGGEYAQVIAPDREQIQRILADPVIASGNLP